MDLQLPGLHGIDVNREIVAAWPGTAVLVFAVFEDDNMVFSAVSAGAVGYLLKGAAGADIVTAVRGAAAARRVRRSTGAAAAHLMGQRRVKAGESRSLSSPRASGKS